MLPGDVVADRFTLESVAGVGGMGVVYRAHDRTTQRTVALKVQTARRLEDGARFEQEALVLRELSHPRIVSYLAHGRTEGGLFLAMEWLEGEDLHARLSREPLTIPESVAVALGVAEALAAAHARGIVHRDIKPSNVFLPGRDVERVKVLDFGVARGRRDAHTTTDPGKLIGTVGYVAPEQATGARTVDARADVFSLGAVLFECIARRPVFLGEHMAAILAKILFEEAPHLREMRSDVPQALDLLVARMLAKEPEGRPVDGRSLALELSELGDVRLLPPSRTSRAPSITPGEQRLLCVVFAGAPRASLDTGAPTLSAGEGPPTLEEHAAPALEQVLRAVARFDGRVERLVDGSVVATLMGQGVATDQAERAARCALVLRELLPDVPIALATGRGEVRWRLAVGDVIDRAASLMRARSAEADAGRHVRLDDVTAGLLDDRFEVTVGPHGPELKAEREAVLAGRTLLGKATPCVGRERELGMLLSAFDQCVTGSAVQAVLVTADAGVGKSRLRHEVLRKLARLPTPPQVWVARADSMSVGVPLGMLAAMLRRAAGVVDGEPLATRREKLAARVAESVRAADRQRVAEFLGELVGAPFPDEKRPQLRAARSDAIVMSDQTKRAWQDFLLAECEIRPLVVVLEDVQWGDVSSLAFLESALRVAADRPWMLLALARPEVQTVFPNLFKPHPLARLALRGLSPRASERLVRTVLGDGVSQADVDRVVTRAGGNAFYLEEMIRALAEGRGGASPGTVLAMVQARLEEFDAETRRALRAASVFGKVFWHGAALSLLGIDRTSFDRTVDELMRHEVIQELATSRFAGERAFRFRHAIVWEAVYGTLTETDRVLAHQLAGAWLEARGESEAAVVAEHFERGAELDRAAKCYQRAAEQALDANDLAGTIAAAHRAVRCGIEGVALGSLANARAEAQGWRGESAESLESSEQALALLPAGSDGWFRAASKAVHMSATLGKMARSTELALEVQRLVERGTSSAAAVVAAATIVGWLFRGGRHDLARSLLASVGPAAALVVDENPTARARFAESQALQALLAGDVGSFVDRASEAVAAFDQAGDLRRAYNERIWVAVGHLELGEALQAEANLHEVIGGAERLGIPPVAAQARSNLGVALGRQGRLEAADAVLLEAIAAFRDQGDSYGEGASRIALAAILTAARDREGALREARAAVLKLASFPPARSQALAALAGALLATERPGDQAEAVQCAGEAMALLESLGGIEEGEGMVRLVYAEAQRAAGNVEAARAAIASAQDHLLARAGKLSDARRRDAFLASVPDNARTLDLARAWLG